MEGKCLYLVDPNAAGTNDGMQEIDAVITWVDGDCPKHKAKRAKFLALGGHPEAATPLRWEQNDEIGYLLRSLDLHAPWLRKVHIVTDEQEPPLGGLSRAIRDKINLVDHREIFRGYEEYLPTFNSVSINSVIHRIEGLSDRFVLFNDDVILVGPVLPEDFFIGDKMVLRGTFGGSMVEGILYTHHRRNAANILGISPENFFRTAHVCIPMIRSLVEEFYADNEPVLRANVSHRFRDERQYLPSALSTHLAILADRAVVREKKDWHFITAVVCQSDDYDRIRKSFNRLRRRDVKIACINDLSSAKKTVPSVTWRIARAVEGNEIGAVKYILKRRVFRTVFA